MERDACQISRLQCACRIQNGQYVDVVDYVFLVSRGNKDCLVITGIAASPHHDSSAQKISSDDGFRVAEAYLRKLMEKGYDPFTQANCIDIPSGCVVHYLQYGSLPD